jgi:tetratricopeptide (TPR) repeat protein
LLLDPGNAEYRSGLAARLIELARPAEAESVLAAIVTGKKDQAQAWVDRGLLLENAGLPDQAAADLARALELLPEDFDIWGSRARLCDKLAANPAIYDRLLKLRPADALLWYVRAAQHLSRREYQAGVTDFARGGEPPATTEFAYIYAAALLLAGDKGGHRADVNRLATRYGKHTEETTMFVLARLSMLAEPPAVEPERGVAWAKSAVERQPRFAWFSHVLALAHLRAGDNDAARATVDLSRSLGWSSGGQSLNDLVALMIDRRQGQAPRALEQFDRIKGVLNRTPRAHLENDPMRTDWLEFQILRGEIEGPLLDAVFPADPFIMGRP